MPSQKVSEIYIDLVARTSAFKAALQDATNETKKFSAQMRSEMNDARGSIKLLSTDLGVGLPRALQSFIVKLPGVASAMSAAFSAVAVIALLDVVVKAGEKVAEFASKNADAARKNGDANREFTASLVQSNAQLDIANDRLSNDIAKLSHKPQNNLKLALDEAKLSAIDLAEKLEAATTKERELLDSQNAAWYQKALGVAGTETVKAGLDTFQNNYRGVNLDYDNQVAAAKSVADATSIEEKRKAALLTVTQNYYNALSKEIAARKELQQIDAKPSREQTEHEKYRKAMLDAAFTPSAANNFQDTRGDQSKVLPALENLQGRIGLDATHLNADITHDQLYAQDAALQAQKQSSDDAKKAAAERLKQIETDYQQLNVLNKMALSQEASYWNSKLAVFKSGSAEYLSVLTKFVTAERAEEKYLSESLKSYRERTGAVPLFTLPDRGNDTNQSAIAKGLEQQATLRASLDETTIQWKLERGAISEHDAALTLAGVHSDEYKAKLATLKAQLAELRSEEFEYNGQNVDPNNAAKQQSVRNQIDELQGKQNIQQFVDAQAVVNTTWVGMIDNVFDELVKKSRDTAGELQRITSQIIDSLNTEMAKAITGQRTNFRQVLQSGSESLAKTGIQKIEGIGLSALGFGGGKRDGSSAAQALYVTTGATGSGGIPGLSSIFGDSSSPKVNGPGGGIASSATHGLLGILNDSDWASSLFGGKLFGAGSIFGGGFALGGDVMAGVPIDVGELGREKFVPSVPGRIIPNNQLGNNGPSIGYIDARGTDPVQTHMAVKRAMASAHRQAVQDAQASIHEQSRRRPH